MPATTLGREIIRNVLPLKYKNYADKLLTKKLTLKLTTLLAKNDPDSYVDILQNLNTIALRVVSLYGKDTTITLDDLDTGALLKNAKKKLKLLIRATINRPDLDLKQKSQALLDIGYKYTLKMRNLGVLDAAKRKTGIANQIASGSRGNPVQLMQLVTGDMMMKDPMNRDIPYVALMPYAAGDLPLTYFISAMSGRKSTYDTQAATGKVGYLSKQAANITHATPISTFDCGTTNTGIVVNASDDQNVGAILLKPWHNHKAGAVVTLDMLALADLSETMIVRSPTTCKAHGGVCALCSGVQLNDKLPAVGSYVALNATKAFTLPLTQAGISSKHGSGVGGKKVEDPDGEDQPQGFDSVLRMFNSPLTFPGGAVLSTVDGKVTQITKAPQGGSYITVGTTTMYSPVARTVTCKVGDSIEAGDSLTNGVPSPALVVQYKGIGAARQYFTTKLDLFLKKAGAGTQRRNVLQFSRAMINKVKITKDLGFKGFYPGDITNYDQLVADWEPRENTMLSDPVKAIGSYLLLPVMYFSIGTKITPNVAKKLKDMKILTIKTNAEPPPFLPLFIRSKQFTVNDPNWIPRLAGLRLKLALFDAARTGITDKYNGPSFIDKVVADPYKPQI